MRRTLTQRSGRRWRPERGSDYLFEQRVSPARRVAFNAVALEVAKNNEDEFYAAWKRYCAANPAPRAYAQGHGGVDSETERIRRTLMGSDDEAAPLRRLRGGRALRRLWMPLRLQLLLRMIIESRARCRRIKETLIGRYRQIQTNIQANTGKYELPEKCICACMWSRRS